jgi:uncharacterized repeat protein (TIGR01451 family)
MVQFKGLALRLIGCFAALWFGAVHVCAQGVSIGWSMAQSASTVTVGTPLVTTIRMTNNTVGLVLPTLTVTTTFSAPVTVLGTTNTSGSYTVLTNGVRFTVSGLNPLVPYQVSLGVEPLQLGSLLATTTLSSGTILNATNATETILASVVPASGDLAVAVSGLPSGILTNDLVSYTVTVTNAGPATASAPIVANVASAGIEWVSVSPTSFPVSVTNNILTIDFPALIAGGVQAATVTFRPHQSGLLALQAGVSDSTITDPNAANNNSRTTFTAGSAGTNSLTATVVSPQEYNPQTGLMEEVVRIGNPGLTAITGVRLFASGLTNVWFNAIGTNGALPFASWAGTVAAGGSVDFVVEIWNPRRTVGADPIYTAQNAPAFSPASPAGTGVVVSRAAHLGDRFLLEFPSVAGARFGVFYAAVPDAPASQWQPVFPWPTAAGDKTQWIDHGPPETPALPGAGGSRFYRVVQLP